METRWLYVTSEEFHRLREASRDVCVIPMGCVEKHGLHLPLGTDIIEASGIAYMASQLETCCVFPDFTFGDVPAYYAPNMPAGSISLKLETEMLLLEELCEQISLNGYKKILIFNGHGGNRSWLSAFLRNLSNKKRDFVAAVAFIGLPAPHTLAEHLLRHGAGSIPELTPADERYLLDCHARQMRLGHACMGETAFIMGLAPEAVHLDRLGVESGANRHIADYLEEAGIQIKDFGWGYNYPDCFDGDDPTECTESIGRAALRFEAERLARAIKVYKDDENLLKWNAQANEGNRA